MKHCEIQHVPEMFGSMVFNEKVMKERLPKDVYKALIRTSDEGTAIDPAIANVVANAMKDWAVSKGVTHYTHWFQPMTGFTAEKHDSFITPIDSCSIIMEFSGKELIKGEPDASSFPSGGLRATFEARGYTAWDPTSYAFIKDNTLCIPTAFCSYTGEILDKKTPLLRSMDAISKQACRILKLFGKTARRVNTTVGAEQEYFLINKSDYAKRLDLILTGRTLFGAKPPKGQEMEDHYFGSIRPRVKAFMEELDNELWKLGITSKTEHNEVAPCQHEMAPVFETTNVATDHNQLTMEVMKRVADKHDFVCLLHEKPFAGINGSGKHNNWSISTDTGENLLEPGSTPHANAQFILFLTAVIKAVDEYQDLLRISAASAGNDHRLGASEAPPAIISIFVGDELEAILDALVREIDYTDIEQTMMNIGVCALPPIPKDTTDRNRTSPFAFTGNKFEFRMPGSSFNIACTNFILNTAVADSLRQFADELESKKDEFEKALASLIKRELKNHRQIIFNGNGYSDEWQEAASQRGLMNLKTTPDALEHYTDEKNVKLLARHGICTKTEIVSRKEILLEEYCKTINIEALTMIDMVLKQIIPSCSDYSGKISQNIISKKNIGIECHAEIEIVNQITNYINLIFDAQNKLKDCVMAEPSNSPVITRAKYFRNEVLPKMNILREIADKLEVIVGQQNWPFPTYSQILFYV